MARGRGSAQKNQALYKKQALRSLKIQINLAPSCNNTGRDSAVWLGGEAGTTKWGRNVGFAIGIKK